MPEPTQNQTPDLTRGAAHETLDPSPRVMGSHEVHLPDHFVAPIAEEQGRAGIEQQLEGKPSSLWRDAWSSLRRNPIFLVSALLMLFVLFVAAFPGVFTSASPTAGCELSNSNGGPAPGHPLGFTNQGCDILARVVHGTGPSVLVGFGATLGVVIIGGLLGALAGYFGGWVDAIISRCMDIFFALPLILGAIVLMQVPVMRENRGVATLALTLVIFGWPSIARITRSSVIAVRNADFVTAARSLGMGRFGILFKHVLPNAAGPVIVIATISLGTFIVAESTLSFLGIGLPAEAISWGNDISAARPQLRTNPETLFWPSLMLSITVLSFIMLGDSLRDALDPKGRTK
ncbi:ABC transporter permease [Kocuria palustris]|mgnify:FL=1|uniref:ABC transporter permease n=1 Tax=Kocuria palustris TaxID=71999 RepID=UPI0037C0A286